MATSRVSGAGDLANAFIGNLMEDLEKGAKADNHGGAAFDVGNTLGDGRATSVAIAEAALYESGRIPVPDQLIVDGQLKPMKEWNEADLRAWNDYKDGHGLNTVGKAAVHAGDSYQSGYASAASLLPQKQANGD